MEENGTHTEKFPALKPPRFQGFFCLLTGTSPFSIFRFECCLIQFRPRN
ncbi:hypothetical protein Psta_3256 [Pirellula staleyi DSM 6068]|uniref:Uncharacterized protein n=1 Tax=Pirellula staleyi (strain ATCC 27377 / DSM 6068 / ICPB 4128) TaxID=530564 RepID=D2QX80_PIRSD|nr:hypothetical protein Psta_3256 [Pirellula staleyi DSM 6068]